MGHLGFRTSSPSRENGFARPSKWFRGGRRTKRVHEIAISGPDHGAQSRASPKGGLTVLLLHLRDVLVVAERSGAAAESSQRRLFHGVGTR
jgi:hypothetical protein